MAEEKSTGKFVGELGQANLQRDIQPPLANMPELGWVLATSFRDKGYRAKPGAPQRHGGDQRFGSLPTTGIINAGQCALNPCRREMWVHRIPPRQLQRPASNCVHTIAVEVAHTVRQICENHKHMVTEADIRKAAEILRSGGLVVFPTETVYGLGANALDASAVRKIYKLKERPSDSPLIVHVASIEQARDLAADWPEIADQLACEYWPGPLTLVVPKKPIIPDAVTAGLQTVGLRIPRHPVALKLLLATGLPIAAPSANRFTQLSPTTAAHVHEAFGAQTPFLLDGGACEVGIESTVIAVTKDGLEVLRPGMATVSNAMTPTSPEDPVQRARRAPGQHKKHYSPRTRVLLVTPGKLPAKGRGAYLNFGLQTSKNVITQRMPSNAEDYAKCLYKVLHEFDSQGLDWIAIEMPPNGPEWAAIRDRLTRAAY